MNNINKMCTEMYFSHEKYHISMCIRVYNVYNIWSKNLGVSYKVFCSRCFYLHFHFVAHVVPKIKVHLTHGNKVNLYITNTDEIAWLCDALLYF